jgi:DNA-directed RNA polymerase specialized sigma24 family protein
MIRQVPSNKEVPLTPYHEITIRGPRRPETPLEALMQAAPGEDIRESVVELQPFREAVAGCIDKLDAQDRFIIDAVNTEMVSLEELGKRLGVTKTHAWRLRNSAMDNLRKIMLQDPTVLERLRNNDETTDYGGV